PTRKVKRLRISSRKPSGTWRAQITKLDSERDKSGRLRSDLVKANHNIEALNELTVSKEDAIERAKKDCHEANNQTINQVVNLKAEKSLALDEAARATAEKDQANQKLADALKQFKAAENRASVAEENLRSAGEENRRLQDELQQLRETGRTLNEPVSNLTSANSWLNQTVDEPKRALEQDYQNRLNELQSRSNKKNTFSQAKKSLGINPTEHSALEWKKRAERPNECE
ncbi:MAG: hypothetical protein Q9214_004525, partial [Letrouitia sp. 1 TL-2023]